VVVGDKVKQAAYYKTATIYYFDEALGIEDNWDLVRTLISELRSYLFGARVYMNSIFY